MGKLDGKVALITGASRGIGKEISTLFASEGAKVVTAARTLQEGDHKLFEGSLETTVQEIRDAGGEATAVAANVSEPEECLRLMEEAKAAYGPVDVLVNNAALNYIVPITDYVVSRWIRSFAVNIHAPFMLSHAALPAMIERGGGAIVNISSGGAIGPGRAPYKDSQGAGTMYGASKAALERFTQGLASELYEQGITVACVSPSKVVATPGTMYFGNVTGPDDPQAEPVEHMARAVLLLATEPPEKVSGRVTYSQQILHEFGWIERASGTGVDQPGSGFSQI